MGIDKLPPELLSLIFWHRRGQCSHSDISWLIVTWVCRRWRRVALSYPALWRTIYDGIPCRSNKSWIPTFLERAAGAPLVVAIQLSDNPLYTVQALAPYAHMLRIFRLYTTRQSILLSSFSLIKTTFPLLEQLELVYHHHEDDPDRYMLPPASYELSRQEAPLLTDLNVSGLYFPWDSTIYSSLRSLCLSSPTDKIPVHRLFSILQACPGLESLSILGALPPLGEAALYTPTAQPVSLPRLRSLVLLDELPAVTVLCDNITAPSSCKVEIHTYPFHVVPLEDSLCAVIPRHAVFKSILSQAHSFELSSDDKHIYIKADLESRSHKPAVSIQLQCAIAIEPCITPDIWDEYLDAFPETTLRDAVISYMFIEDFTLGMWRSFGARFSRLETLRVGRELIHNVGGVDIFMYLLLWIGGDPAKESSKFPRHLRLLELRYLILDERTLEALVIVLEARRDYGYPLAELTLTDAYCRGSMDVDTTKRALEEQVKLTIRYSAWYTTRFDDADSASCFRHLPQLEEAPEAHVDDIAN